MGRGEAYLEARVLSADPLELVCLLYQRGLETVRDARRYMAARDIAGRAEAISKTLAIIGELNSSLDHNAGGDVSGNLERLYSYMTVRLTEANMRREEAPLVEVERLLTTLAEAWKEVRARTSESAPAPVHMPAAAWQESGEACAVHAWSA